MKTCAACHEDLPKEKFSKKQWKLNLRRCKVCVADNREVQQLPPTNNEPVDSEVGSLLSSMSISDQMIPVSDEELFKQPPKKEEDCPICFLRMPSLDTGYKYESCCGKVICSGCIYANSKLHEDDLCPFCRIPAPESDEEQVERAKKRMEVNDAHALFNLAQCYGDGTYGCQLNRAKALELYHRAGEMGNTDSYHNIGNAYLHGRGVERDMKKARHYWELAAIGGDAMARHNLGVYEKQGGNMDMALKHFMNAVEGGSAKSLHSTKVLFTNGHVTKEDYANALRARQSYLDEVRSKQRDEAGAYSENYKYY
jgi:hypothetical protein